MTAPIAADVISLSLVDEKSLFWISCNKLQDFASLYLIYVASMKTTHGKMFFWWFRLADNWVCESEECGNQTTKGLEIQLSGNPTSMVVKM